MKKVFQTIVDKGRGNCFAACLASLLEIDIENIPDFLANGEANFDIEIEKFLRPLGLTFIRIYDPWEDNHLWLPSLPGTYFIISLPSQKYPGGLHAVVGTVKLQESGTMRWEVVHDPNAGNAPYGEDVVPKFFTFLVALEPWKHKLN
jgi:hypothetical protein